mmetsp:Transcript_20750/g.45620  ORF Transcript_20750/g.45620 Transcript_20750/m.45620 type:complete len:100 (-) Transcript_20750:1788-2087(-)
MAPFDRLQAVKGQRETVICIRLAIPSLCNSCARLSNTVAMEGSTAALREVIRCAEAISLFCPWRMRQARNGAAKNVRQCSRKRPASEVALIHQFMLVAR